MGTRRNRLSEAVLTCTNNICFEQNMKIVKKIKLKIVIFTAVTNAVYCVGVFFRNGY